MDAILSALTHEDIQNDVAYLMHIGFACHTTTMSKDDIWLSYGKSIVKCVLYIDNVTHIKKWRITVEMPNGTHYSTYIMLNCVSQQLKMFLDDIIKHDVDLAYTYIKNAKELLADIGKLPLVKVK